MPALVDLTGQKFGRLTVLFRDIEYQKSHNKTNACWRCQCDFGNQTTIIGSLLKNGHTKSCGCLHAESAKINGGWRDLSGKRFGKLRVIKEDREYREKNQITANHCYWECICDCGNTISILGNSLLAGSTISCGCMVSKGEEKIRQLLLDNNILFETQKTYPTCVSKKGRVLRFDFFINNSFLVEFDGKQHYQYNKTGWNNEENFLITKENDTLKTQWCKNNHIPLKRIPYWELDNITIENILDDTYLVKEN